MWKVIETVVSFSQQVNGLVSFFLLFLMDLVFASHLILDTVKRTTSLNVPIISFSIQNLLGASYQGWVSKLSRMHGGV